MDYLDSEGGETLPIPPHDMPTLRSILIATAGFWLIVAWALWSAW
jgi:hypothetical protein